MSAPADESPTGENHPDENQSEAETPLVRVAGPQQRVRSFTHAVLLVLVAFLVAAVIQQLGLSALAGAGMTEENAPYLSQLVPMALHFVGFFVVVGAYLLWRSDESFFRFEWPTGRDIRWMLLGFSALVGVLIGLEVVLSQFGLEPADNVSVEIGMENPRLFLYFIPLVLFLNAPAEELLFRGLVQGLFRRSYGVLPGIIAAALIFGVVHYVALVGTGSRLAYVLIAFISGLILGALYEYTENLFVPIAVHAFWNVLVYLNLYASATGLL